MTDFLSGKIKKIPSDLVSPDRYNYFKPGEVEPDLGVPVSNNALAGSDSDASRKWLYPNFGLSVDANGNIDVVANTIPFDSTGFNYTSANNINDALFEMDFNIYNDVKDRLQQVGTDGSLIGDGTANNILGINPDYLANTIFDTVTADFIDDLNVDANTWAGNYFDDYMDQPVRTTDTVTFDTVKTTHVNFNTEHLDTPPEGQMCWNSDDGTVNLGLSGNTAVLQIGQENVFYAKNATANTIPDGTVVGMAGAQDGRIIIEPYVADGSFLPEQIAGVTTEDIAPDQLGYVTTFGYVRGLDTSSYPVGSFVYASSNTAGEIVFDAPISPALKVIVGMVTTQDLTDGEILVRPNFTPVAGDITYDNSLSTLIASNVQAAIDELDAVKADSTALSSTLYLYATTANSDIVDYNRLVESTDDLDYDTPAINFSTGAITGANTLIAELISDDNIIEGNPGIINTTVFGNIRKTSGTDSASFYYELYKRDAGGTETLISQSSSTQEVTGSEYVQFSASSLLNNGSFVSTDRIVVRFYGSNLGTTDDPIYDFQFGGGDPVRILIPVPVSVIPDSTASDILVDTSTFNNKLQPTDSNVQLALNRLDDHFHTTSEIPEGSRLYHTATRVNDLIDARVTKTYVDNLNVDADTLDGLDSTYLLNYNNLTNKPIIGDGQLSITASGGLSGSGTFTANQVDPTSINIINTDKGSDQSIFKNIVVPGESNIVASTNDDTINVVPGSNNVILTTDPLTNTLSIAVQAVDTDVYVDSVSFDDVIGRLTFTRTGGLPNLQVDIAQLSANAQLQIEYSIDGSSVLGGASIDLLGTDSSVDSVNIVGTGATDVTWSESTQTITIDSSDTQYTAGAGLNLTGTVFSHLDTSSVADLAPVSGQYISGITFDTYGHVQTVQTASDLYVTGGTFDANTSILTLTRSGGLSDLNVEFAGLQFEEVDTLDSVTTRGNTTTNTLNVGGIVVGGIVTANSFFGDVVGTVSDISNHTTDDLLEGSLNQYFTTDRANTAIVAKVTKDFVDSLNIDADTFDGADSSYYLNYNNILNKPDSILDFGVIEGNSGDVLITDGAGTFTFQSIETTIDYAEVANNLVYMTTTEPQSPYNKQIWFDYDDGFLYFYDSVNSTPQWRRVEINSTISVYADVSNTAPIPDAEGHLWYDTTDGTISVYSGNNWVVTSGPVGPQGPAGNTGPEGPPGPQGNTGPAGEDGLDGVDGTVAEVSNTAPEPPTIGQLWYDTDDATISVFNGSSWVVTSGPAGPAGIPGRDGYLLWSKQTANYAASRNEGIMADTTGGQFTITLPESPGIGDIVVVGDGGDFSNTSILVAPSAGDSIEGAIQSFEIDVAQTRVDFVYDGTTWQVFSNSGPQGPVGPQGPQGINGTVAEVSNTAPVPASDGQLWFDTNDATISVYDGTNNNWIVTSGPMGPQGLEGADGYLTWTVATSNTSPTTNQGVIADTAGGSFTVTLPSTPSVGDIVVIADGNDWSINSLIVSSSATIENSANDFEIDVGKTRVDFIYNGSTWKLYSNQGPQGPAGADGPQSPTAYALTLIFA